MAKRSAPQVNAGSMADIAFLLLIFFLVTTTIEKDTGINRKLPPMEVTDPPKVKQKNIFTVQMRRTNGKDELLVENVYMDIDSKLKMTIEGRVVTVSKLTSDAVKFLDNNGDGSCKYCDGKKDPNSSDNPNKAIIYLENRRETSYGAYITVQNELLQAYNILRNKRALSIGPPNGFSNMNFLQMKLNYKDPRFEGNKEKLKELIDQIKIEYPLKLSEISK